MRLATAAQLLREKLLREVPAVEAEQPRAVHRAAVQHSQTETLSRLWTEAVNLQLVVASAGQTVQEVCVQIAVHNFTR